ncbi:MAG: FG-GAP-like repeat-containing protein [Polyangiaceae bacterium]|nr:FG-GAP-like repeat-containing protein [Polyangiaceae bacterium]
MMARVHLDVTAVASLVALTLVACTSDEPSSMTLPDASPASSAAPLASAETTSSVHSRARLDGRDFPDKVLALSWDDGPDASTFELAAYLAEHRISATFFVVGSWIRGLSDDPGSGKGVYQTGYEWVPILGDLVALGHRIGNHTLNHVVLRERVGEEIADHELRDNQRVLDAYITNELRLFRAPGGGWGSFAENVVDGDAYLSGLVGPVFWDIDRKDWDESLDCTGSRASTECEHHGPSGALRMKPSAVAARYLEAIQRTGHGIVLLHDRVGDVGSRYALTIAHALIPELEARGYVFSAPVLHFSPLTRRLAVDDGGCTSFSLADIDGDGRADVCGRTSNATFCAVSVRAPTSPADRLARTIFQKVWEAPDSSGPPGNLLVADVLDKNLVDVDGDGRVDLCAVLTTGGIACATSDGKSFGRLRPWSLSGDFAKATTELSSVRFADLNGDGRADVCAVTTNGFSCALSTGRSFARATPWLSRDELIAQGWQLPERAATLQIGDINGDGRADVCGSGAGGIVCGMAP